MEEGRIEEGSAGVLTANAAIGSGVHGVEQLRDTKHYCSRWGRTVQELFGSFVVCPSNWPPQTGPLSTKSRLHHYLARLVPNSAAAGDLFQGNMASRYGSYPQQEPAAGLN